MQDRTIYRKRSKPLLKWVWGHAYSCRLQTAPAFILLVDQMGWSVSSCLTRTVRRVQIQLQVSKIYLVSYLSVINVCVWEAGRAPPRPAHSHHCRGHGWDPTWRSIPTSARFWEGVSSDTILLSRRTLGRGDGVWYRYSANTHFKFLISTLRGSQRY